MLAQGQLRLRRETGVAPGGTEYDFAQGGRDLTGPVLPGDVAIKQGAPCVEIEATVGKGVTGEFAAESAADLHPGCRGRQQQLRRQTAPAGLQRPGPGETVAQGGRGVIGAT